MNTVSVRIEGVSPLLMHSAAGVDASHPYKRESREITAKGAKKRTDKDEERLLQLDFLLSLYHDGTRPIIPEECILGMIRDGARRTRQGKEVLAGVMVSPSEIPVIYDGPTDPMALFESLAFRDVRPAGVQKSRVTRCRPRFNKWALEFDLVHDEQIISEQTLRASIDGAGQFVGLCDFRPRFGRFEVTKWKA